MKEETALLNKSLADNKEAVKLNTREMQASREQNEKTSRDYKEVNKSLSEVIDGMEKGMEANTVVLEKIASSAHHLKDIAVMNKTMTAMNETISGVDSPFKKIIFISRLVGFTLSGCALLAIFVQIYNAFK